MRSALVSGSGERVSGSLVLAFAGASMVALLGAQVAVSMSALVGITVMIGVLLLVGLLLRALLITTGCGPPN